MATPAQIAANRRNALRSTGPRTPEGKTRVARNRLVHGLRSRATLLPGENPFEFLALLCRLQAELRPRTALESCCVLEIARARWKVSRGDWLEAVLSERAAPDLRTVASLWAEHGACANRFHRLLRLLRRLQALPACPLSRLAGTPIFSVQSQFSSPPRSPDVLL